MARKKSSLQLYIDSVRDKNALASLLEDTQSEKDSRVALAVRKRLDQMAYTEMQAASLRDTFDDYVHSIEEAFSSQLRPDEWDQDIADEVFDVVDRMFALCGWDRPKTARMLGMAPGLLGKWMSSDAYKGWQERRADIVGVADAGIFGAAQRRVMEILSIDTQDPRIVSQQRELADSILSAKRQEERDALEHERAVELESLAAEPEPQAERKPWERKSTLTEDS